MAIDMQAEELLTFRDAAAYLKSDWELSISLPCLRMWVRRGTRGVRLESTLVGGRRFTSKEALSRFLKRVNREPQSKRTRKTASVRAEALKRLGVK